MSTFYDDAEFYAIALARIAAEEMDTDPRSQAMLDKAQELIARHGQEGLDGLIVALSRLAATATLPTARREGLTVPEFLDSFAMHKAEQHADEEDGGVA